MRVNRFVHRNPPMLESTSYDTPRPAVVVFCGDASILWLRWLRPGFRHCFVAVQQSEFWIVCDSLAHRTDLTVLREQNPNDLAEWYKNTGLIAVQTTTRQAPLRLAPLRLFTCVESVKRVLGIHAPWVFTPWQLYRLLTEKK
jgi:hypothetical protein